MTKTFTGLSAARGFALGPAYVYRGRRRLVIPEQRVSPGTEEAEIERLRMAREQTRHDMESLIADLRNRTHEGEACVFESHLLILEDPLLIEGAERFIREERYNAAAAARRIADQMRQKFSRMAEALFRERVHDLDDVEHRLLERLLGVVDASPSEIKDPVVILADDLTPSETIRLPRDKVLGFAMGGGSVTSHVALLARAMGIPAVTGLGRVFADIMPGQRILLDGTRGMLFVDPGEQLCAEYERRRHEFHEAGALKVSGALKDGSVLALYANAQAGVPYDRIGEFGARGIGLYRSEYLWLDRENPPTEDDQFAAYRAAAECAARLGDRARAVIRILDIGGDKFAPGVTTREPNPFLGNRSLRYLLSHRDVLRTQLRAILRASAFGPLAIMYPMVSAVEELRACAEELARVREALAKEDVAVASDVPVGAMIEVPAAALNAAALAREVDFFSIGTNDLIQYVMAADRGNEAVAYLYQPLNPAIVHLVRHVVEQAHAAHIPVSVCGESASEPVEGLLWAAFGVDALSMSASFIPSMAALLAQLTRRDLADYATFVLGQDAARSAREIYRAAQMWLATRIPNFDRLTT